MNKVIILLPLAIFIISCNGNKASAVAPTKQSAITEIVVSTDANKHTVVEENVETKAIEPALVEKSTSKTLKSKPAAKRLEIKEETQSTVLKAKPAATPLPPKSAPTETDIQAHQQKTDKVVQPYVSKPVPNELPKKTEVQKAKKEIESTQTSVKQEPVTKPTQRVAQTRPMHKYFNTLLQANVSADGMVNYQGIKSDMDRLNLYLADLKKFPPKDDWSRDDKLAYWINVYNAFTLKLVADHYPVESITNLEDGKPWDLQWIEIGDQTYSLNQVENEIIRPQFKEPRIHFAVNCAAKSCPPLSNKAYTSNNLESMLEANTIAFINNPKYNDLSGEKAKISKIFEWYGEDFGDVVKYINKYMKLKRAPFKEVEYKEYDWNLNSK